MKTSRSHPQPSAQVSPKSRSMLQITAASGFGLPRPPRRAATSATRKGKIARLPFEVREQLHGRLREGEIDPASVRMIRDLIPREADAAGSRNDPGIDWRLHLGRGYVAASESFVETDLIFVHDLVLPCAIGAYDFERGHTQNVRFNIDADVQRNDRRFDDMRGVFSYDVIIDSIKIILGRGHVDLIETLASSVADEILRYPCVARVCVRIEKLDVVRGTVGVEIKRERTAEQAAAGARVPAFPGNAA